MTVFGENTYQRILNYVNLIQLKPNKDIKYFHFDDGKKFIIDGRKLKILPFELHHLYSKDEFYVHVNPLEKKIMFWAYDINDYVNGRKTNEEDGYMVWDDLETCIYNFFAVNIKDLTNSASPYADVNEKPKTQITSSTSTTTYSNGYHGHGSGSYPSYTPPYYTAPTPYSYGTSAYKEREAFYDKLMPLIKDGKTTIAMDLIDQHICKMCNDKKFDELDVLLRMITFDKLNIPTMICVLNATKAYDSSLKARRDFFNKVKTHITKIRPSRVNKVLGGLEPVKTKQNNPVV